MATVDPVILVEFLREEILWQTTRPARNVDLAWLVATAFAEQYGRDTTRDDDGIRTDNSNAQGNTPEGSIDRGLWMVNDHWHAACSNECAFDWRCATRYIVANVIRWTHTDVKLRLGAWAAVENAEPHLAAAWLAIRVADARAREAALKARLAAANVAVESLKVEASELRARLNETTVAHESYVADVTADRRFAREAITSARQALDKATEALA